MCVVRGVSTSHNTPKPKTMHCTVYCVLCNVHCVLCTVYCVLCTVYCVLCTVYCVLCTVHCVLCTVYCVRVMYATQPARNAHVVGGAQCHLHLVVALLNLLQLSVLAPAILQVPPSVSTSGRSNTADQRVTHEAAEREREIEREIEGVLCVRVCFNTVHEERWMESAREMAKGNGRKEDCECVYAVKRVGGCQCVCVSACVCVDV